MKGILGRKVIQQSRETKQGLRTKNPIHWPLKPFELHKFCFQILRIMPVLRSSCRPLASPNHVMVDLISSSSRPIELGRSNFEKGRACWRQLQWHKRGEMAHTIGLSQLPIACTSQRVSSPYAMIRCFRRDILVIWIQWKDRHLRNLRPKAPYPIPHMIQEPSSSIHKREALQRPSAVTSNDSQHFTRYRRQTPPVLISSSLSSPSSSAFAPPSVLASHHRASCAFSNLRFPVAASLLLQFLRRLRLWHWVVLAVRRGHPSSMSSLPSVERQHHFPEVR